MVSTNDQPSRRDDKENGSDLMDTKTLIIVIAVVVLLSGLAGWLIHKPETPAPIQVVSTVTVKDTTEVAILEQSKELLTAKVAQLQTLLSQKSKLTETMKSRMSAIVDSLAQIGKLDSNNVVVARFDTTLAQGRLTNFYVLPPIDLWRVDWQPFPCQVETHTIYQAVPYPAYRTRWYESQYFRIPMEIGAIYLTYKLARK
jgi:hypothetical protein